MFVTLEVLRAAGDYSRRREVAQGTIRLIWHPRQRGATSAV